VSRVTSLNYVCLLSAIAVVAIVGGTAPIVGATPFDRCCIQAGNPFKFCAPGIITVAASDVTCE